MAQSIDRVAAVALERLAELEVQSAVVFAQQQQALVDFDQLSQRIESHEFVALDIAVACGIGQQTASHRVAKARRLVLDLPRLFALTLDGALTVGQVISVLDVTQGIALPVLRQLEQELIPAIIGMTPGDTTRLTNKIVKRLDAAASEERRAQKAAERRAFVSDKGDGRAFVGIDGSAEAAIGFWESLSLLARLTFGTDDTRTLDQQRADLALELAGFALASRHGHGPSLRGYLGLPLDPHDPDAEGGYPCDLSTLNDLTRAQRKRVQCVVVVPMHSALGLSEEPGELVGFGPISAAHARDLLAAAELRQAACDLTSGRLIALSDEVTTPATHVGRNWGSAAFPQQMIEIDFGGEPARPPAPRNPRAPRAGPRSPLTLEDALLHMIDTPLVPESRVEPRHDPSPDLADFVRLRDTRCLGPGCSQPASSCDLEHWTPYPQGSTSAANLRPASRRCHNAKTYGGWSYRADPDGSVTWTKPDGTTHYRPARTTAPDLSNLHPPTPRIPPHQR